MAKERKNKKRIRKQIIQSTQQNIPIKEFYNGIIVTKDNQYIKIIEVLASPFSLKSVSEQNMVIDMFTSVLKVAPINMQIKTVALPANITQQLRKLDENIQAEPNENCKEISREYRQTLIKSQSDSVSHRFFVILKYDKNSIGLFKEFHIDDAVQWLNTVADRVGRMLEACDNKVVLSQHSNPNYLSAEILYTLLNRNTYQDETCIDRIERITKKYIEATNEPNPYIPPCEILAPSKISFNSSRYLIIDGMYYSFAYIPSNGYNPNVMMGWLSQYINSFVGVDFDFFLFKEDSAEMLKKARKAYNFSSLNYDETPQNSDAADTLIAKMNASQYIINSISAGSDFFNMCILMTVCGTSPEEVDSKLTEIINVGKTDEIKFVPLYNQNEIAYFSSLPLCNLHQSIFNKAKRNVLSDGASSIYPFTSFELNDEDGIYFGNDISTNSMAIVDIFNRSRFQNSNIFICGQTGAGKTYTLLLMALRMRIKNIPVYLLAPEKEHEFRRVCNAIGGQFIQIGAGSPDRINVMEIFPQDDENSDLIDGSHDKISYLSEKVTVLKEFIQLLIHDMSLEEKQLLDTAIVKTYNRFGITNDNNSLIDPLDPNKKRYKKMPILSDLQETLKNDPKTDRINTILKYLTEGSGSSFNGQTNIDLNNNFTVFGLEKLSNDNMPLGIYLAMDYVWSKIKQDRTKRKVLIIDEWWKMAFNPIAAEYSLKISKIIRAYAGAMVLATQQMTDILAIENGKFGGAVLNNCAIKILMKMSENDAEKVQEIMHLTDEEMIKLTRQDKGQALFAAGSTKMGIKFIASKTENDLITTDLNELKMLAEREKAEEEQRKALLEFQRTSAERLKKQQEYLQRKRQEIEFRKANASDISDLFEKENGDSLKEIPLFKEDDYSNKLASLLTIEDILNRENDISDMFITQDDLENRV